MIFSNLNQNYVFSKVWGPIEVQEQIFIRLQMYRLVHEKLELDPMKAHWAVHYFKPSQPQPYMKLIKTAS